MSCSLCGEQGVKSRQLVNHFFPLRYILLNKTFLINIAIYLRLTVLEPVLPVRVEELPGAGREAQQPIVLKIMYKVKSLEVNMYKEKTLLLYFHLKEKKNVHIVRLKYIKEEILFFV